MARVVVVHPADATAGLLEPRDDAIVREAPDGADAFVAADGPFRAYRRELLRRDDGTVEERTSFHIATRFWGLLFVPPFRRELRQRRRDATDPAPWWAPPERFDRRGAEVFGMLLTASIVAGYLGTVITQTLTYVGDEFHLSVGGQANVLSAVRASVVLLVPLSFLADRLGRRRIITLTAGLGCLATAAGAVAPNLFTYGVSQSIARGFAGALVVLIAIVSAEEVPAGSRAWAYSLLAMTQSLGAGICVLLLRVADLDVRAWRLLYVLPLLMLPLVLVLARQLPESRRFEAPHPEIPIAGHGRRFWLLATTGFLLALFAVPASQLGNEFLREARGFSAARISLFTILTVTPGAIGIVIGGRMADVRGRRLVGAVAVIGGALLTVLTYASIGSTMWVASTLSYIVGSAVVPALGVYRPELFPTSLRGKVGGVLEAFQVAGAVAGLQLVGGLVDHGRSYGSAFGIAAIAPAIVAVLVIVAFPETAHRSLEDLNPEDEAGGGVREAS